MISYHMAFREYHNKTIRQIRIVAHSFLAILSIVYLFSRVLKTKGSVYFIFLACLPLSWKIGIELENYLSNPLRRYLDWLCSGQKAKEKPSTIFYIQDQIEQIKRFGFLEYYQNKNSLVLETISTAHRRSCSNIYCFCKMNVRKKQLILRNYYQLFLILPYFTGFNCSFLFFVAAQMKGKKEEKIKLRKRQMVLHLDAMFHDILQNVSGIKAMHFYYINFLVD